jgi:hypothetical protein
MATPETLDRLAFRYFEESNYHLGQGATELGFLFTVQLICAFALLNRLNGRPWRMDTFFYFVPMDLDLAKHQFVNAYLRVVGWSMLVAPIITLIVWSVLLIHENESNSDVKEYMSAGASLFFLGLSFGLAGYTVLRIKWNNYRMKTIHMILVAISYISFTLWQFLTLYLSKDPAQFVSISAVYLTQNGFMLFLLILLNAGSDGFDMTAVLKNFVEQDDTIRDPDL